MHRHFYGEKAEPEPLQNDIHPALWLAFKIWIKQGSG